MPDMQECNGTTFTGKNDKNSSLVSWPRHKCYVCSISNTRQCPGSGNLL